MLQLKCPDMPELKNEVVERQNVYNCYTVACGWSSQPGHL